MTVTLKKAEVTKLYQLNFYCEDCKKRLLRVDTKVLSDLSGCSFTYRCPSCGGRYESSMELPAQMISFDESSLVSLSEEELSSFD